MRYTEASRPMKATSPAIEMKEAALIQSERTLPSFL
jgi:hypothetical protein